jgi:hypothetical protein
MIQAAKSPIKKSKIEFLSYKDWLKGTVTAFDDPRIPTDAIKRSTNVRIKQNGTLAPRPSLRQYGTQPLGTILGDIYEFTQVDAGTKIHWMGCLQNVSGTTKFYIAKDGGTWTVCNGKTFDNTAIAEFLEIDNKVLIMNGKDRLAYFDVTTAGTTNTVVPFTALSNPTVPTLTATTGLTGTNFNYYYIVVAHSSVGMTAASPKLTVAVSAQRETWNASTQNVQIAWSAVTGAKFYSVFLATVDPAAGGTAYLLSSGVNGTTYTDNGTAAVNVSSAAPVANSTAGPIASRGTVINGQVFLIDAENPHNVRAGGNQLNYQLDFSDFGGGGDIPIGIGTKEFPVSVKLVQSGQGAKITVFCRGTNGYGKRYIIKPDTITSGNTVISFYGVEEDNGEDGTDSPRGVVMYRDDAWYPSREGFKKTGVKPQLQTMLKTDTISETIAEDVKGLSSQYMDKCVGLANNGIIYWALPVGSTENNEIWMLDVGRGGAWIKSWFISASAMTLYNDNTGETHHLILSNNVIYELTEDQRTQDQTIPFPTSITSGRIKFSENGQDWAKVLDVTFVLGRPAGDMSANVNGKGRTRNVSVFKDKSFSTLNTVAGWGEAGWGGAPDQEYAWSITDDVPVVAAEPTGDIVVKVNKLMKWLVWEMSSTKGGVNYEVTDIIVRFVRVGYIKESAA